MQLQLPGMPFLMNATLCIVCCIFYFIITRNSSGDEIANVNFLYDDIVQALLMQ